MGSVPSDWFFESSQREGAELFCLPKAYKLQSLEGKKNAYKLELYKGSLQCLTVGVYIFDQPKLCIGFGFHPFVFPCLTNCCTSYLRERKKETRAYWNVTKSVHNDIALNFQCIQSFQWYIVFKCAISPAIQIYLESKQILC